jgi:hypothetical protein
MRGIQGAMQTAWPAVRRRVSGWELQRKRFERAAVVLAAASAIFVPCVCCLGFSALLFWFRIALVLCALVALSLSFSLPTAGSLRSSLLTPLLVMSPDLAVFIFIVLDTLCGSWTITYYGDRIVSFGKNSLSVHTFDSNIFVATDH